MEFTEMCPLVAHFFEDVPDSSCFCVPQVATYILVQGQDHRRTVSGSARPLLCLGASWYALGHGTRGQPAPVHFAAVEGNLDTGDSENGKTTEFT